MKSKFHWHPACTSSRCWVWGQDVPPYMGGYKVSGRVGNHSVSCNRDADIIIHLTKIAVILHFLTRPSFALFWSWLCSLVSQWTLRDIFYTALLPEVLKTFLLLMSFFSKVSYTSLFHPFAIIQFSFKLDSSKLIPLQTFCFLLTWI